MSNQSQSTIKPRDANFRAPLRKILDSVGTGRHVEGIHIYDKDDRRKRVRIVQFADGLGLVDDLGIPQKDPSAK